MYFAGNNARGNTVVICPFCLLRSEQLMMEILAQFGFQSEEQIIFSGTADLFPLDSPMTQEEFNDFLKRSKGNEGHYVLYLFPVRDLRETLEPDCRCLAKLSESMCVGCEYSVLNKCVYVYGNCVSIVSSNVLLC